MNADIENHGSVPSDEDPTTAARSGRSGWDSPGRWLTLLGFAHVGVGVVLYHDPLVEIARSGVLRSVPDHGDRATAFWYTVCAPTMWLGGRLLQSAESAGDLDAQRAAGGILIATGLLGTAAMPASGFWGVTAIGAAALRRSMRSPSVERGA